MPPKQNATPRCGTAAVGAYQLRAGQHTGVQEREHRRVGMGRTGIACGCGPEAQILLEGVLETQPSPE
jgi:hypothetical protein